MSFITPYAPMTTSWSLPLSLSSRCLSNVYLDYNSFPVLRPSSSCIPPGPNSTMLDKSVYYSPGLAFDGKTACPTGFTEACSRTLTSGRITETAVTCCPSFRPTYIPSGSLSCQPIELALYDSEEFGHYGCTMRMGPYASYIDLTVTGSNGNTTILEAASTDGFNAHSVQVRWQSSDLTPFPTLSQKRSSTSAAVTLSATATSETQQSNENTSGLSSGAKIAIGVVTPICVIIAVTIGFFIYRRKSRYRDVASKDPAYGYSDMITYMEQERSEIVLCPLELDGDGNNKSHDRYELPAFQHEWQHETLRGNALRNADDDSKEIENSS